MDDAPFGQPSAPTVTSFSHAQFLRLALDTLSMRVTRWVTLAMAFALFAGALWKPDWIRLAAACGFTVLVYLPLLYAKRG